jgi:hypothetical protein
MLVRKEKRTQAHQRKFPPAPPSPRASAFTARPVKGRCAFHSATLHCTPDVAARLRPARHTRAAPGKISFQSRTQQKAGNGRKASRQLPSSPSVSAAPLFIGGAGACRVNSMCLSPPRPLLSSIGAFAYPNHAISLPHARLFVLRHPGGPAYGTCTRATARYPFRLARGFAPSDPARPVEDSGLAEGIRR